MDIKNVFLNDILDEEVYIEQLSYFVAQRKCANVCRLKKLLYGLRHSLDFGRFALVTKEFGFYCAEKDHSVF